MKGFPCMPKILVVDDETGIRQVIRLALQREPGYVIEEAATGLQALKSIAESPPDLMIIDFHLPDVLGSEVIAQIRKDQEVLPIIFLSGATDVSHEKDVSLVNSFLPKPFKLIELVKIVRLLLENATPH